MNDAAIAEARLQGGTALPLDDLYLVPLLGQEISRCRADDTGAENDRLHGCSLIPERAGSASPGIDRPDVDQRIAAHAVVAVVEIDRRIAVRYQEFDGIAELEASALGIVIDTAMFIA